MIIVEETPKTEDRIFTAKTMNAITITIPTNIFIKPDMSLLPKIRPAPAATIPMTDTPNATGPVTELTIFSKGDSHGIPVFDA